jgi:hypothetical protein
MRSILLIVLLVAGAGLVSCRIYGRAARTAATEAADNWVRTTDGWERVSNWTPSLAAPPAVHPVVIAAGQLLFSLLALAVALPPGATLRGD